MWYPIFITAATGYLLGNINGAVCISALLNDDVRSHGSGNAGLTNFFRNFGGKGTLFVLIIDMIKTLLACAVGSLLLKPFGLQLEGCMFGGVCASLGHDFPALLGFRGGKGIVCGLSVAIAADWRIAVMIVLVFLVCFFLTHYVSLGSILASATFGIAFGILHWGEPSVVCLAAAIAALAVFMHRSNISRLLKGTESKVYLKKKGEK